MRWCRNIYFSDSVADKKRRILHKMKHNKLQINVYAIILPLSDTGIMEIYPSYIFLQNIYKKQPIFVIGIAADRTEAYELAGKIAGECYNATGTFNISEFIGERQVSRS